MRKIKDPSLFQSIRKFLTEDMPVVRKKSANTVEAYRYMHTAVSSGSWCGGQRQQCGDSGSGLR